MRESTAVKLAVDALSLAQKRFVVGHNEYLQTRDLFDWAKKDHKKYMRMEQAKDVLRAMLHKGQQLEFGATPLLDADAREVVD